MMTQMPSELEPQSGHPQPIRSESQIVGGLNQGMVNSIFRPPKTQLPTRILLIQDGLYLTLREVDGQEPVLLGYVFGSLLEYQPLKGSRRKAIRVVPDPYPDLDAVLARVM